MWVPESGRKRVDRRVIGPAVKCHRDRSAESDPLSYRETIPKPGKTPVAARARGSGTATGKLTRTYCLPPFEIVHRVPTLIVVRFAMAEPTRIPDGRRVESAVR